jgi:hypothetical protein
MLRIGKLYCDVCLREIRVEAYTCIDYFFRDMKLHVKLNNDICRQCRDNMAALRIDYFQYNRLSKFSAKNKVDNED